ncbi:LysR family substrate-binding domain-containing protein [Cryobacterium sp. PH31-AA6]|uniref:LysR family substrate-binding domain-containing protein n=1 Tax=Cryobacterium sp. PH31-AA6 TaxID=3046205 RepID=UPI0024BB3154|nr:LysR family substrate-binding domain-containing protein [Cryobacterium sp. PH31-AA6]MDJ0324588.1 LysR family substrate-binding domain-containing protein [Cryobacterium sp. PH31-AA6]
MTFSIAFVAGVTPTKWTRIWAERRPDQPLEVFRTDSTEQDQVLRDGRAQVSLVRLPIDETDLSLIALYREIPVVVAAKNHFIADQDSVLVADLADDHLLQDPDSVPEWRAVATEIRDGTRRALPKLRDLDEAMEQVAAGVGILIVPHSIARLHGRKDVVSRPVEDVAETQVSLAWLASETTEDVEEFIGIVRGRTKDSSRIDSLPAEKVRKEKKTDKAKAAAKAVRVAAAKAKPAVSRKTQSAPGRTRPTASPKKGKRRGSR